YRKAIEYADLGGKEKVIDAYCGIGTIGIAASDRAGEVLGVESNREAVKDAKINADLNGIRNIRFTAQDAGAYMMKMAAEGERADVLFMDPPRAGSSREFIEAACAMAPRKIVYISCNPETLVRDLKEFEKRGYAAKRATAFDAFCWTPHTEAVTLIEPRTLHK
ncbi:MAG: class I SAM-dependent RNA methyltransferase, partial [Lachnospiraceae bacterium]|nr:class I SAM-dependent RNA methyltransferase [Lachnospiraceae bacterium]